jgi:predicted ATPase
MRAPSSDALLRFKNEFRALQDLHHANLVNLLDLIEDGGTWWLSMELVRGVNLLAYLRRPSVPAGSLAGGADTAAVSPAARGALAPTEEPGGAARSGAAVIQSASPQFEFDEARLRATLEQLVEGLHALHAAGKVHRDVKPENVLVTEDGRVVILDFGLISDSQQYDSAVVGTIAYMAPEQAAGQPVGPAADWYSVGALLFEALTGCMPFEGTPLQVLADKQVKVPPAPATLVPGIPADLDRLCVALLHTEPAERPDYGELRRQLRPAAAPVLEVESSGNIFVGRAQELEQLAQAYELARVDQGQVVLLHGESGIGKTELTHHFVAELARRVPELIVLAGRCYEHEMVPYKAVDGIVDSLAKVLRRLPRATVAGLLPRRAALLRQVFPVLGMVPGLAEAKLTDDHAPDPHEQRNRFFAAFRSLLTRVAEHRPLVLLIDDLQWTDQDSMALLSRLMSPPETPPLLMLITVRSGTPVLTDSWLDPSRVQPAIAHIELGRLPDEAAVQLAQRLLRLSPAASSLSAQRLAGETAGHPLFLRGLVYHSISQRLTDAPRFEDAIWDRVQALPTPAQRLLHLAAVMGRPLSLSLAERVGPFDLPELNRAVAQLRAGYLLRAAAESKSSDAYSRDLQVIEPYHDRVRETIVARLGQEQRQAIHRDLALHLEQSATADPEALTYHFEQAQLNEKAAHYARQAADAAAKALAFERAARFYRLTLQLLPPTTAEAGSLYRCLGDSLACCGRGREAGAAYLKAAAASQDLEQRKLQTRAADQLMRSGDIASGVKLLRELLTAVGLRYPETPGAAIRELLWTRLKLWLRGLKYEESSAENIPARELLRLDILRAAGESLSLVDVARGAGFRARFFHLALQVGEPFRVALGAMLESSMLSIAGLSRERDAASALALARRLVGKLHQPHADALLLLAQGSIEHNFARWRAARELFDQAEAELRAHCTGIAWEVGTARFFSIRCSLYLGEFRRVAARLPADLDEAITHGDLYAEVGLRSVAIPFLHLVHGSATEARRALTEAERLTERFAGPLQQFYASYWASETHLYEARAADALALQERQQALLKTHHLWRVQLVRVPVVDQRGRSMLVLASQARGAEKGRWLKSALKAARQLEAEDLPLAQPMAKRMRAGVLAMRGDPQGALRLLTAAAEEFDAVQMKIHAAGVRYCLGQLLGGQKGQSLIDTAEAVLLDETVYQPAQYVAMSTPGFISQQ